MHIHQLPLAVDPSWLSSIGGLSNLSGAGLAGLAVLAILGGWLIPRWVYQQLAKEVEYLRTAIKEEQAGRKAAIETTIKALSAVEKFEEVLDSFREGAQRRTRQGGDRDEVAVPSD